MRVPVNGTDVDIDDRHETTPLLWVLRDVLGMRGTKFGCGAGFCAACTVLIDGKNEKSCQTPAGRAVGRQIITVEGVSGPIVDAVRDAWYRENVVQCGYCQPGQTLAAMALLEANPYPDDPSVAQWMNGNLCRCGTYPRIRRAIQDAANRLASADQPQALTDTPEPETAPLTKAEADDPVRPYIRIRPDGTIVVFSSQIEMGQGIHTGLATIVAEELDADFDAIQVVNAANGRRGDRDVYGNPESGGFQITGASNSTKGFWGRYRPAAAKARARLVGVAAERWQVPPDEVRVEAGVLRHPSGLQATFAEVAAAAERLPVPDGVEPKPRSAYKLIGREGRLRVDAPGKILGQTRFTIDVALPGLLTAVVLHPPRFGAKARSIDDRAALGEAGVVAVVPIEEGVAVVGETFHDAHRGLQALDIGWDDTDTEQRSSDQLLAEHRSLVESAENAVVVREDGDVEETLAAAAHVVDGIYELPYLAHAPMEPNNAVCRMGDDGVIEVWSPTESPEYVTMAASNAAGVDRDRIRVHVPLAGGSFGLHSSAVKDPTSEAVQVAKALDWKYPIKVQSLREEEFKSGRFRAMSAHRVRAGTDSAGRLIAVHHHVAAQPTSVNLPYVGDVMFKDGVDFFTTTGAVDNPYRYPAFRLESTNVDTGVPLMVWRSVGNSHTEFARESAIDEVAVAAERDPIDLRRELLKDNPRTLRALELAASLTDWDTPPPEGHARGVACSGFLSPNAQIAEVTLDRRNRVHIERIVFTLDCGIVINPDLIRAQVEGGAPALANAIAALTGTRIRRLPINKTIRIY